MPCNNKKYCSGSIEEIYVVPEALQRNMEIVFNLCPIFVTLHWEGLLIEKF